MSRISCFTMIVASALVGLGGTACSSDRGQSHGPSGPTPTPCISKASQVVMIGDSYIVGFNGSPKLQPALSALVPDAAGWRNYAVVGMAMASGGLSGSGSVKYIPQQFDPEALQADPNIKLVIMNGGGDDILLRPPGDPDCRNMANSTTDPTCLKIVQDALDAATAAVTRMWQVGVHDVIYFFYPNLPSVPGGIGGTEVNVMLDFVYPQAKALCDSAESKSNGQLRCHFIDLRKPFADTGSISGAGPWTNIWPDGVHPTEAGQAIIAQQIVSTMQAGCVGQPASSGCCAP